MLASGPILELLCSTWNAHIDVSAWYNATLIGSPPYAEGIWFGIGAYAGFVTASTTIKKGKTDVDVASI